jgi:AAA+ ATPase superfamily predicted ATPase
MIRTIFKKYILSITALGVIGTFSIINFPNQFKYLLPIFMTNKEVKKNYLQNQLFVPSNKYIHRMDIESNMIRFLCDYKHANKYCILYGPKNIGKSTLVNYMMNNYLLVCKINIKNKKDLSNYMKEFVNVYSLKEIQNPTIDDVIDVLKEFKKEKYFIPKIILDISSEDISDDDFIEIKNVAKALIPYCKIIIIIDKLDIQDNDENIYKIQFNKIMAYHEAREIFYNNNIKLSEEEYNLLKTKHSLTPTKVFELAKNQ